MGNEVLDIDTCDTTTERFDANLWRAVIRPLVLEMHYNQIRSITITRTGDKGKCSVQLNPESESLPTLDRQRDEPE